MSNVNKFANFLNIKTEEFESKPTNDERIAKLEAENAELREAIEALIGGVQDV